MVVVVVRSDSRGNSSSGSISFRRIGLYAWGSTDTIQYPKLKTWGHLVLGGDYGEAKTTAACISMEGSFRDPPGLLLVGVGVGVGVGKGVKQKQEQE